MHVLETCSCSISRRCICNLKLPPPPAKPAMPIVYKATELFLKLTRSPCAASER